MNKQLIIIGAIVGTLIIVIVDITNNEVNYDPNWNPHYSEIACYPSDEAKTQRCLESYNCHAESTKDCITEDFGYLTADICANTEEIIVNEEDGCFVLQMVNTTVCGGYSFSIDTDYECATNTKN